MVSAWPRKGRRSSGHAIARLADSGEDAMRNLVALPLRMLAGALGIGDGMPLLLTAADAVSKARSEFHERAAEIAGAGT